MKYVVIFLALLGFVWTAAAVALYLQKDMYEAGLVAFCAVATWVLAFLFFRVPCAHEWEQAFWDADTQVYGEVCTKCGKPR